MCDHPAQYVRYTEPGADRGIVRELAALSEKRDNKEWLKLNCGDKFPKSGATRAEFACRACFISRGWDYEL